MSQNRQDNILNFQKTDVCSHEAEAEKSIAPHKRLHPKAKRRRLIWLVSMVIFLVWVTVQLIVQQINIWDRQEQLAIKQKELASIKSESKEISKEIQRLQDDSYLLELAHKLGYGKPNEKNYQVRKN